MIELVCSMCNRKFKGNSGKCPFCEAEQQTVASAFWMMVVFLAALISTIIWFT